MRNFAWALVALVLLPLVSPEAAAQARGRGDFGIRNGPSIRPAPVPADPPRRIDRRLGEFHHKPPQMRILANQAAALKKGILFYHDAHGEPETLALLKEMLRKRVISNEFRLIP